MERKMKKIVGLFGIFLLIGLDQFTKYTAKNFLEGKNPIELLPGIFELQYLENRGAAFGILQDKGIFLIILTIFVTLLLIYIFIKIPSEKKYVPLHLIGILLISGALGNMIDRLWRGYVIDFFYFKWIDFPIFNVADCYVTISACLLIFLYLFYYKEEDFSFLFKK